MVRLTDVGFQLTHSRGVRPVVIRSSIIAREFQLTHSRGVRLIYIERLILLWKISTHALTWSATVNITASLKINRISTHALTWSATRLDLAVRPIRWNFNSRTHVECDQPSSQGLGKQRHFNSRTHVECDIIRHLQQTRPKISTHALTWSATSSR